MLTLKDCKIGFWRKRALKNAIDRKEDRSPINYWSGHRITKLPSDCFAIQHLFFQTRPQVVIELGSSEGGSAAFFSEFAASSGIEEIISLDIVDWETRPQIDNITWLIGDDTSHEIALKVKELVGNRTCAVIIDANHHGSHVKKELEIYGNMVSPGHALIMEDTHVDILNFKIFRQEGGPLRAFMDWLPSNNHFHQAPGIEPYITTNYFGYWIRNK